MLKQQSTSIGLIAMMMTGLAGCVDADFIESHGEEVAVASTQQAIALANGTLAVITTNALKDGSTMMGTYAAFKQQTRETIIVTENKTYLSNGVVESSGWGDGLPLTPPVTFEETDARAEAIYDWLKSNYIPLDIEDVLLIGNPDPTGGDVPMKALLFLKNIENLGETENQDIINSFCLDNPKPTTYAACTAWKDQHHLDRALPTDFYYANMSYVWPRDADGDISDILNVDYLHHELNVGRVPIQDNDTASLDKILAKFISYTADQNTDWRKNALLGMDTHSVQEPYAPGSYVPYAEAIRNDILDPNDFDSYRVYVNFTDAECEAAGAALSWFPVDVCKTYVGVGEMQTIATNPTDGLNAMGSVWAGSDWPDCSGTVCSEPKRNFGLVSWSSHGGNDGAADIIGIAPAGDYTESLDDTHPAFVTSASCNNAMPDTDVLDHDNPWMYDDNVGAALLRNGAIGFIGATRVTWPAWHNFYQPVLYQTNVGSTDINYGFILELIDSKMTGGEALAEVRLQLGDDVPAQPDPGYRRGLSANLLMYNLYGDPTIGLENPPTPAVTNLLPDVPTDLELSAGESAVYFAEHWQGEDNPWWNADIVLAVNSLSGEPIPSGTVWVNGTAYAIGGAYYQRLDIPDQGPYTITVTTESDSLLQITLGNN